MAVSNTSSAYDLSGYQQEKKNPQLKVMQKKRQMLSYAFTPKILFTFFIVITFISLIIYNQAQLNEISAQVNSVSTEIDALENEHINLKSQLDSLESPINIAEKAENELGLTRLDKFQTEYVHIYREHKVELTENAPTISFAKGIKLKIYGAINRVKEYIGG